MLGLDTLDVAIGLAFLFFILSLVVTAAREMIEGWMQTRAAHLERGMRELLRDPQGTGLASQIYNHPLVNSLYRGIYDPARLRRGRLARLMARHDDWPRYPNRSNLPAYIPARNFALALLDSAGRGPPPPPTTSAGQGAAGGGGAAPGAAPTFEEVRAGLAAHLPAELQRVVQVALDNARGDLEEARANLEKWFDSGMDRVSGWYRRNTQWIVFLLGLIAAVVLNIDTLRVAGALYANDAMRTVIVAQAEATVQKAAAGGAVDEAALAEAAGCTEPMSLKALGEGQSCAQRQLQELGYPIGWNTETSWRPWDPTFPWTSLPGWLITALALTLGAPFWFDLLNKIMVIRSTVKPHEKSPEESSEDRQTAADPRNRRSSGGGAAAGGTS